MFSVVNYENAKNNLDLAISSDSDELNAFLQRFYAINVVREIVGQNSDLKKELGVLSCNYLKELYSGIDTQKIVGISDSKGAFSVTTMAIMEKYFPEFLDGSFNPNAVSREGREIARILFENSSTYGECSKEFKESLNKITEIPPINRNDYDEVKLSGELVELLYEPKINFQR